MKKHPKALVLLSGGLDSILAAKLLMEQGVEVTGLIFKSCFFDETAGVAAAEQLGISRRVVNFSEEHLEMVKKPSRGYGKAANPCIDCHLLMLAEARGIMEKEDYDFVATGEVLGERPFSQNKQALELLARESGLEDRPAKGEARPGRLLRPLSAKLLSPTLPEEKGWVDREKLWDIQGRRRLPQIELAKKYKLTYPGPSGGCVLCEKEFAKRLFELFEKWPQCSPDDIELLKLGRHFWSGAQKEGAKQRHIWSGAQKEGAKQRHIWSESEKRKGVKIVLGRNQDDNQRLKSLAKPGDILLKPGNFPGPLALIRGKKISDEAINKAKSLMLKHSKKLPLDPEISAFPR